MEYLPVDILTLIYNKLNINDLENIFKANNCLPHDEQFWVNYFKFYNLEIIEEQENNEDWVIEFKVSDIINKTQSMIILQCKHEFRRGIHKGKQCTKNTQFPYMYCETHQMLHHELVYKIKIDCNVNALNYLKDFFVFGFNKDLCDIDYFSTITLTKNRIEINIKDEEEILTGFGIYELYSFLQALFKENVIDYIID